MKKILLMAASAAMIFTSCITEKEVVDGDSRNVTVRISNAGTKAIQAPGTAATLTATLSSGYIFLIAPNGGVVGTPTALSLGGGATDADGGGQVISGVPSSSRVYIVGNIASDAAGATELIACANFPAIQAYVSDVFANQGILHTGAPLINDDGQPATITIVSPTDATAGVNLTPAYARLELAGVTGGEYTNPTDSDNLTRITGFEVVGVYVDEYYEEFTYGGSYPTGASVFAQNQLITTFAGIGDTRVAAGDWPATGYVATPYAGPVATLPAAAAADAGGPAGARSWAYNVPAGSIPRLIIAVTGVTYEETFDATAGTPTWATGTDFSSTATYYLTVTGYNTAPATPLTTNFVRGNIYQVSASDMTFTTNDLHSTPNPVNVDLTVTVTIGDWVIVPLIPNL
jgi:hypothetical protein